MAANKFGKPSIFRGESVLKLSSLLMVMVNGEKWTQN